MIQRRTFLALLASPAVPASPAPESFATGGFTLGSGSRVLGSCLMMVNGDTLLRRYNLDGDLLSEELIKGNAVLEQLPWKDA